MRDSTEKKWHYAAGGEQKGPFSVEQLTALVSAGAIHANTLVWTEKLTNWEPLARTELASLLGVGPLQPPPLASAKPMLGGAPPILDAPVISLGQAISVCFSKYATFSGRANRPEFWYFYLFIVLVVITAAVADILLFGEASDFRPITSVVILALLIPHLSVSVRRLHDTDRSGWWYLISLVPLAGTIVLIVFWCQKGTPARNTYG